MESKKSNAWYDDKLGSSQKKILGFAMAFLLFISLLFHFICKKWFWELRQWSCLTIKPVEVSWLTAKYSCMYTCTTCIFDYYRTVLQIYNSSWLLVHGQPFFFCQVAWAIFDAPDLLISIFIKFWQNNNGILAKPILFFMTIIVHIRRGKNVRSCSV